MSSLEVAATNGANAPAASVPEAETPRYSRQVTLLTMLAVLLVMLLASLDQTIVGTALPHIIAQLQGFDRYTWVTTAYLLTSTVMVPIYGKLSDMFGRKPVMITAVVLFLMGSAMSGAAQTMTQLILFRGFQGLGAGGLMSIAIAIIGDLFTPRERAKWQGVTGAVFGVAFIFGPTAGGWLTDNGWLLGSFITTASRWRWVFYVNLPIGLIALLVLIFLMPTLYSPSKKASIDYLGAALLIAGTVPLLLGFTWAGTQYDWNSPQIIGLFSGAGVALLAFFLWEIWLERRDAQPIINPSLFRNGVFTVSVIATMLSGMAMFGSIYYIPLFVQGVVGTSATNSGVVLTPMMLTAIVASIVSGLLVARLGHYKPIAIIGAVLLTAGTALLLRLDVTSQNQDVIIGMLVLGLGLGASMSLYNLIVQNALPKQIGQASAALTFFRQIGATIGLAGMGAVLNAVYPTSFQNALPATVAQVVPPQVLTLFNSPQILLQPDVQAQLQQQFGQYGPAGQQLLGQILGAVKVGVADGLHQIFLLSLGIAALSVLVLFFLKELPLRGGASAAQMLAASEASMVPTDAETAAQEGALAGMMGE
jgi:EmrB/QacA subfamily drug resistance transporter